MYSIFHPLDPNERLPRELILEGRRHRLFDRGTFLTMVGALYLPMLILMVVVLGSFGVGPLAAFGIAGVALVGVYLYVVTAKER